MYTFDAFRFKQPFFNNVGVKETQKAIQLFTPLINKVDKLKFIGEECEKDERNGQLLGEN